MDFKDKQDVFRLLESQFLTYKELKTPTILDTGEEMVSLTGTAIHSVCFDPRMEAYTGSDIYVRKGVLDRLLTAQSFVDHFVPNHKLSVFYGYRHLDIQKRAYKDIKEKILSADNKTWDENDLQEEIHRFIAVPDVAGHPTGGAVDITLIDADGKALDMGTDMHEFVKESYVFCPFISKQAWRNRQKLRQCMMAAGFAPFDGEWWHFSYGDSEWAYYYDQPSTLYGQIDFKTKTKN